MIGSRAIMDETDITRILGRMKQGQTGASEELLTRVYNELRRIAAGRMRNERRDHTLQPTALVHEAYLRLVKEKDARLENRAEFFAAAANLMRHILIDHARAKQAKKRGGERVEINFDEVQIISRESAEDLITLDEALQRLANSHARQSKIFELRVFGGLSIREIAELLGIGTRMVDRDWHAARVWLQRELTQTDATNPS